MRTWPFVAVPRQWAPLSRPPSCLAGRAMLQEVLPRLDDVPVCAPRREGSPARPPRLQIHWLCLSRDEEGAHCCRAQHALDALASSLRPRRPGAVFASSDTGSRPAHALAELSLRCFSLTLEYAWPHLPSQNLPCPRGDACNFAHNVFEYWLHPSR